MFGLGILVGLFLFPVIEVVLDKVLPDPFQRERDYLAKLRRDTSGGGGTVDARNGPGQG